MTKILKYFAKLNKSFFQPPQSRLGLSMRLPQTLTEESIGCGGSRRSTNCILATSYLRIFDKDCLTFVWKCRVFCQKYKANNPLLWYIFLNALQEKKHDKFFEITRLHESDPTTITSLCFFVRFETVRDWVWRVTALFVKMDMV